MLSALCLLWVLVDEGGFSEGGFSVNHGMHCLVIGCDRSVRR